MAIDFCHRLKVNKEHCMNDDMTHPLAALAKVLTSPLVSYPDDIRIEVETMEQETLLTIKGNQADTPKLIGTGGRSASAIRSILRIAGERLGIKNRVTVLEGWTGIAETGTPYTPDLKWNSEKSKMIVDVLSDVAKSITDGFRINVVEIHSEFRTRIALTVSTPIRPSGVVAFQDIFRAIGRKHGRDVHIDVQNGG